MMTQIRRALFLSTLLALPFSAVAADGQLSSEDVQFALAHFQSTNDGLMQAVSDLSEAQWNYKSAQDRWSIAEVVEHITLGESTVFQLVTDKILKTPITPGKKSDVTDQMVITRATDRSQKVQARERVQPTGRWPRITDAIQAFQSTRTITTDYLKATQAPLRSHFATFEFLGGDVDAFQWLLFASAHCERHLLQINEIKTDPDFPGK